MTLLTRLCAVITLAFSILIGAEAQDGPKKPLSPKELDLLLKDLTRGMPPRHAEIIRKYLEQLPIEGTKEQIDHIRKALEQHRRFQPREHYGLPSVDRSDVRIYNRLGARLDAPCETMLVDLGLPEGTGQVLIEIFPGTPAAAAGFKANDIVVDLNGKPVASDPTKFIQAINQIAKGAPVSAVVVRDGRMVTIERLRFEDEPVK
jgi:C-terminal processing protease CtpA/Prc